MLPILTADHAGNRGLANPVLPSQSLVGRGPRVVSISDGDNIRIGEHGVSVVDATGRTAWIDNERVVGPTTQSLRMQARPVSVSARCPPLCQHVIGVVSVASEEQVVRVNTDFHVAFVAYQFFAGLLTMLDDV